MNNLHDKQGRYAVLSTDADYFSRIMQIEEYAIQLLPFIPRGLPVYQSHGIPHSLTIITHLTGVIHSSKLQVTIPEIFLLFVASWFHDIGYLHPDSIINRRNHPTISALMIHTDPRIQELIQTEEFPLLDTIIRYHASHEDLLRIRKSSPLVRTTLISALFRLADAMDIGTDRCPPEVYHLIKDGLNDHQHSHWLAHHNVLGVTFTHPMIIIRVRDFDYPVFRERIISHLKDDCDSCNQILIRYGIPPFQLSFQVCEPDIRSE
jgi:hypothetical protein